MTFLFQIFLKIFMEFSFVPEFDTLFTHFLQTLLNVNLHFPTFFLELFSTSLLNFPLYKNLKLWKLISNFPLNLNLHFQYSCHSVSKFQCIHSPKKVHFISKCTQEFTPSKANPCTANKMQDKRISRICIETRGSAKVQRKGLESREKRLWSRGKYNTKVHNIRTYFPEIRVCRVCLYIPRDISTPGYSSGFRRLPNERFKPSLFRTLWVILNLRVLRRISFDKWPQLRFYWLFLRHLE